MKRTRQTPATQDPMMPPPSMPPPSMPPPSMPPPEAKKPAKKPASDFRKSMEADATVKKTSKPKVVRTRPTDARMKLVVMRMLGVTKKAKVKKVKKGKGGKTVDEEEEEDEKEARANEFRMPKDAAEFLVDIFVAMFTSFGQKYATAVENSPIRQKYTAAAESVLVNLIVAENRNITKDEARKIPPQLMTAYRLTTTLGKKMAKEEAGKQLKITKEMSKKEKDAIRAPILAAKNAVTGLMRDKKTKNVKPGMSIKDVYTRSETKKKIDWSKHLDVTKSFVAQKYVSGDEFKSAFAAFKMYSKPASNKWESVIASVLGNAYMPSAAYGMWHATKKGSVKTKSIASMLTTTLMGTDKHFFGRGWRNKSTDTDCMAFPGKTVAKTLMKQGAGGDTKPSEKAMRMAMFAFSEILARVLRSAKVLLDPKRPMTYSLDVLRQAVNSSDARQLNNMLQRLTLPAGLRDDVTQGVPVDPVRDKAKTGYMAFAEEQRPIIRSEEPTMKQKDILVEIGKKWKAMSAVEKEAYNKTKPKISKKVLGDSPSNNGRLMVLKDMLSAMKDGTYKKEDVTHAFKTALGEQGIKRLLSIVLELANAKGAQSEVFVTSGEKAGEKEKNPKHKKYSTILTKTRLHALTSTTAHNEPKLTKLNGALDELRTKFLMLTKGKSDNGDQSGKPEDGKPKGGRPKGGRPKGGKHKGDQSDKPKMPPKGYIKFFQEQRPTIAKDHPDMKPKEMAAEAGRRWKALDPADKQAYNE